MVKKAHFDHSHARAPLSIETFSNSFRLQNVFDFRDHRKKMGNTPLTFADEKNSRQRGGYVRE